MQSSRAYRVIPLLAGLLIMASLVHAQNYPSGPVRIIVPFPPGGATDVLGRVLSLHLQNLWGSPVVSEYRPGAAGLIGTRQVASAPADGYTLLMASTGAILTLASSHRSNGETQKKVRTTSPATSRRFHSSPHRHTFSWLIRRCR